MSISQRFDRSVHTGKLVTIRGLAYLQADGLFEIGQVTGLGIVLTTRQEPYDVKKHEAVLVDIIKASGYTLMQRYVDGSWRFLTQARTHDQEMRYRLSLKQPPSKHYYRA